MRRRVIFIILLAAVMLFAGLAITGAWVYKNFSSTNAPYTDDDRHLVGIDTSKDFGACTLLVKESISSVFKDQGKGIYGPDNMGLVRIGGSSGPEIKGDQAQLCVYSFASGGEVKNGFNGNNSFSFEVYRHADQKSADAARVVEIEDSKDVADTGARAYFVVRDGLETTSYRLVVFTSELTHYSYVITQPNDADTFTAESAQEALETIAGTVEY